MRKIYRKFKTFDVIFEVFETIFGVSKTIFEVFDATFGIYIIIFEAVETSISFKKFVAFIINNVEIIIIIHFIVELHNIIVKSNYNFRN